MVTIDLTEHEYLMVMHLTFIKCSQKPNHNMVKDNWLGGNITGALAEFAFGKHENLFWDFTSHNKYGSCDFISRKGSRIDVKATDLADGNLIVDKEHVTSDVYVLANVNKQRVTLVGYQYQHSLIDLNLFNRNGKQLYGGYRNTLRDYANNNN